MTGHEAGTLTIVLWAAACAAGVWCLRPPDFAAEMWLATAFMLGTLIAISLGS